MDMTFSLASIRIHLCLFQEMFECRRDNHAHNKYLLVVMPNFRDNHLLMFGWIDSLFLYDCTCTVHVSMILFADYYYILFIFVFVAFGLVAVVVSFDFIFLFCIELNQIT